MRLKIRKNLKTVNLNPKFTCSYKYITKIAFEKKPKRLSFCDHTFFLNIQ